MAERHPCDGCAFFGGKTKEVRCCNYYMITSQRRPCPPGEGCIVRKDGQSKRRKAMTVKNFAK